MAFREVRVFEVREVLRLSMIERSRTRPSKFRSTLGLLVLPR
jgi:hypothetical protein